jgi:ribosomal protein S18 acetylase RimI-like enzyme
VEIARATTVDAPAILELQKICYRSEAELYGDYDIPPLLQTLEQLTEEMGSAVVLKVTDGERLIGSVRAREDDGACHIGRLIVDPDRQNQGVGRRLMAAIEACFPAATRFELFTGERSDKNLSLYAKLGYREFSRERLSANVTLVYLRKSSPTPP